MVPEPVIMAWSGGKDSALALFEAKKNPSYRVSSLLTTVTEDYDRISMHGVRCALLERQAQALGLPLHQVLIPKDCPNPVYEEKMKSAMLEFKARGIVKVAFGDIFLEDLRQYREQNLARLGMSALFPIWKQETKTLAQTFIAQGFQAIIACVDSNYLDPKFSGALYDRDFLAAIPPAVDPCGENGEFHSFVFAGPIFPEPIPFRKGEVVLRENRFAFCDLLPG